MFFCNNFPIAASVSVSVRTAWMWRWTFFFLFNEVLELNIHKSWKSRFVSERALTSLSPFVYDSSTQRSGFFTTRSRRFHNDLWFHFYYKYQLSSHFYSLDDAFPRHRKGFGSMQNHIQNTIEAKKPRVLLLRNLERIKALNDITIDIVESIA